MFSRYCRARLVQECCVLPSAALTPGSSLSCPALGLACVFSCAARALKSQLDFACLERPMKNRVIFCHDIFKPKPPKS